MSLDCLNTFPIGEVLPLNHSLIFQKACQKIHRKSVDRNLTNPEGKSEKVLQDQEIQAIGSTTQENPCNEESFEQERGFVDDPETTQEVDTFCLEKICSKGIK